MKNEEFFCASAFASFCILHSYFFISFFHASKFSKCFNPHFNGSQPMMKDSATKLRMHTNARPMCE